jgi:hypothetical protein
MKQSMLVTTLMTAGLVACSAQVQPDYRGEPLAVIRGALVTGEQVVPSEVDAALVWVSAKEGEDGWPVARVRVRGEFPAQFTIEVLDPPPASEASSEPSADPVLDPTSIGLLAAIAPNSGDRVSYDEILGVWLDGGVEYFWRDANGEPNDFVRSEAERRKIPATQGYHLFRQISDEQIEGDAFRCQYRDLCVQNVSTTALAETLPEPGWTRAPADSRAFEDAEYDKCLTYLDHPATCTLYNPEPQTADEQAEQARCQALSEAAFERYTAVHDTVGCSDPWQYVETPAGFDFPVSIELGTNWVEWLNPRYRP